MIAQSNSTSQGKISINSFIAAIRAEHERNKGMDKIRTFWNSPWVDGFLFGLLIGGIIFLLSVL